MITKHEFNILIFFTYLLAPVLSQSSLSCDANPDIEFFCQEKGLLNQCRTFAVLHANSRFSSLSSLSSFLGISTVELQEANGFPADTMVLSNAQLVLIPIECKCSGTIFEAELRKTTRKGESFYNIAEALQGLTTCKSIWDKNPSVLPWGAKEEVPVSVPLRCGCPSDIERSQLLLSYPVKEGDTIGTLAVKFDISPESILSANNRSKPGSFPERLLPFSTILIPEGRKPVLESLAKPQEANLGNHSANIQVRNPHKERKMQKIGVYVAVSIVLFVASIAIGVAFMIIHWKKKRRQDPIKHPNGDLELQKLSLSVRTTSDKKVSFEGSQYTIDDQLTDNTPHKMLVENYTIEELEKASEDFSLSNLIEGSVFHGRLRGKNLAIKRVPSEYVTKIDFYLFYEAIHHHSNIIRFLGSCLTEGPDAFIVFEYAKNGSLKDWLHGGLAMKSHFVASCYCFLTWNQRLKICLDVATALLYMHCIMNPSYVHRNIKSRNIFLDEDFNAKVGNFGMARCVEDKAEDLESCTIQWDKGYLAPEYIQHGLVSPSIDIFAYGVILLEVLSGKKPIALDHDKGEDYIKLSDEIKHILRSENADRLRDWMDSALGENYSFDGAVTLANLARSCVEDDPSSRPNAGEIVEKLLRLVEELPELRDQFNLCESSCKPLVKAAANNM